MRLAQTYGVLVDRYAPGGLIQCDVSACQHLLDSAFDATKHGFGAGNDLFWIEGLDDVVVSSAFQPDNSLGMGFSGRQHDYWNV